MLLFPLVHIAQYSCWVNPYNILGFPEPFYSLGILGLFHSLEHPWPISFLGTSLAHFIPWASSTRFIPRGILDPFHSFILLTFPWIFAKYFGLPKPNYHILYFWVYWPLNQSHLLIPFLGLLRPYLLSFYFFWFSWAYYFILLGFLSPLACFGATLLFCGLVDHYSYHLGFNGFYFTTFSFFTLFSYCSVPSVIGTFC